MHVYARFLHVYASRKTISVLRFSVLRFSVLRHLNAKVFKWPPARTVPERQHVGAGARLTPSATERHGAPRRRMQDAGCRMQDAGAWAQDADAYSQIHVSRYHVSRYIGTPHFSPRFYPRKIPHFSPRFIPRKIPHLFPHYSPCLYEI